MDMIDNIYAKLCEYSALPEHKQSIPKEILDDINREYQSFIVQKESLMDFVKETNKQLLSQINTIAFPSLDKYLSTLYSSCKKQGFTCDLCHSFNVGTLKGLAAHKRGCIRKSGGVCASSYSTAESDAISTKSQLIIAVST